MLTLAEVRDSRVKRIAGNCGSSSDFVSIVNDAARMLMRRGNFWACVQRMTGCVYNDCIVWPRAVQTILAINRCGHSIPPRNYWYGFSAVLPEDVRNHGKCSDRCWGDVAARDNGTTPVFNQIPCLNDRYVRFYPSQPTDIGKTITIFGIDTNGQTIRSERSDGTFQDGVVLTLAIPFVQTTFLVRRIDRVLKDQTNGPVHGYQFDGATLYNLADYAANETNPDYRQSRIEGGCHGATRPGCCPSQITALVKLAFVPAQFDDDIIGIDNIDALAMMVQAINQSDNYDAEEFRKQQLLAIAELNCELRERLPLDSTPVDVQFFGTARLSRQRIGRLI